MYPRFRHAGPNVKARSCVQNQPAATEEESSPLRALVRPAGGRSPFATTAGKISEQGTRSNIEESGDLHFSLQRCTYTGGACLHFYRRAIQGREEEEEEEKGQEEEEEEEGKKLCVTTARCRAALLL